VHHEIDEQRQVHATDDGGVRPVPGQPAGGEAAAAGLEVGEDDRGPTFERRGDAAGQLVRRALAVRDRDEDTLLRAGDVAHRRDQAVRHVAMGDDDAAHSGCFTHSPLPDNPAPAASLPGAAG
jgi:hypothetical protein